MRPFGWRWVVAAAAAVGTTTAAYPFTRLACLGDSITRGDTLHEEEPNDKKDGRGNYPLLLDAMLDGVDVANFGASGAAVQGDLGADFRGKSAYKRATEWEPDAVVIMLGINDAKFDFDADAFRDAYSDLLRELEDDLDDLRTVFVVPPYLAIGTCCDIDMDLVNDEIPEAVVAFAADVDFDVPVVLWRRFDEDARAFRAVLSVW